MPVQRLRAPMNSFAPWPGLTVMCLCDFSFQALAAQMGTAGPLLRLNHHLSICDWHSKTIESCVGACVCRHCSRRQSRMVRDLSERLQEQLPQARALSVIIRVGLGHLSHR